MSKGMSANDVETTIPTADSTVIITNAAADKPPQYVDKEKEKRFSLFKAAMFMLRGRKEKETKKSLRKAKSSNTLSNLKWKKLVGSMRPMHLQETTQSPSSSPPQVEIPPPTVAESVEEMITTPASPASPAPSSSGTMSQYASAMSLQDLVDSDDEEEEDPDQVFDAITGDDMIDVKAEEFIAQFYKQIQLQNTATPHPPPQ